MQSAQSSGGSNYYFYKIDYKVEEPPIYHGVIAKFHEPEATRTITAQLQQMYANGQRRLRLPILHGNGLDDGINMNSAGGNLDTQSRTNLRDLLALIRGTGFHELQFSFHPQWNNDPLRW